MRSSLLFVPRPRLVAVVLSAGGACGPAAAQNLLVNPGFESGFVPGAFVVVNAGSTFIDGWGVTGQPGHGVDVVSVNSTSHWAHTGRQAIDLAGTPGPGTIYQDVDTEPGELFTLVFEISSNNLARSNAVEVRFGGESYGVFDSPAQGTWRTVQIDGLEAADAAAFTRLEFVGLVSGYQGALIDSVSLTAMDVPAPGAAALLLVGGTVTMRRRR